MSPEKDSCRQTLLRRRARRTEAVLTLALRLCSYTALVAAGIIFLHIAYRGAPAVFQAAPPFLNLPFLSGHPQTLHVFQPREQMEALESARARLSETMIATQADNGAGKHAALQTAVAVLENELREASLRYSDDELRQLASPPSDAEFVYTNYSYSAGGIGTAIVGTLLLIAGSMCISLPLGLASAIYLSEYSRPGLMLRIIRLSVLNLSGVPSIVFGLVGFGVFVLFFGWGVSLVAGWFTLALVALPMIIASSEEVLRSVPRSYREASLGLGASKWTMIRTNVLPYALPGLLTTSILAIARVAGETAAILFTAAFALRDLLPWEGLEAPADLIFQGVMALPYHIYVLCAKLPQNAYTQDMQYGTVFVLLILVGICAGSSIYLRQRIRTGTKAYPSIR